MNQATVAGQGFQGVSQRMSVIERFAEAGLLFIQFNHLGLQFAAALNDRHQTLALHRQQSVRMQLQIVEKRTIDGYAILDDLGKAGAIFAFWQC